MFDAPAFLDSAVEPEGDLGSTELPDAGKRLAKVGKRDYRRFQLVKHALADSLEAGGRSDTAHLIRHCCTTLIIDRFTKGTRIRGPNECKHPACPTAQLARQRRLYRRVSIAVERYLERKSGMQGLMLTVTMQSCPSHELGYRTGELIQACSRLMTYAKPKRAVKAYVRSVEFTRNALTAQWHVHAHHLLFVDRRSYFFKNSKDYMTHEEWGKFCKKALRATYTPVVDIRVMKGVCSPLTATGLKSLHEIIKYEVKPSSLVYWENGLPYAVGAHKPELYRERPGEPLKPMLNVPVKAFSDAVKGRRLVAMSRNLEADEDLDFCDDPRGDEPAPTDLGEFICTEFYQWRGKGRSADFFLIGRSFDEPQRKPVEGFAMGP